MKRAGGCALCLAMVLAITLAWAQQDKPIWTVGSEPLQINSESLEARPSEGLVRFEGDVVAHQGDLTLQADRVEVRMDLENGDIRSVVAVGSVHIQKGDITATGGEATYDASRGIAVLSVEPKAWRGRDVVAGEKIILHLAEDRFEVEGGARIIIYPGRSEAQEQP